MNRHSFAASLVAVTMLPAFSTSLFAADFSIQPRASIGVQYYEFDVEDATNSDAEVTYLFGGLGVTGQLGKFFVDIYGQTNLSEAEEEAGSTLAGVDRDITVDRDELNLTAGYAFTSNVTVFGGLKYARNDIENDFSDGVNQIDIETTYFGPFAGLALAFPISDFGSLSASGSLAYLDGETDVDNEGLNLSESIDGGAIGYNVGLGWSGRLGPATSPFGYGVGVDYSVYQFEDDGDDIFDEKTLRGRFDLKYRF